MQAYFGKFGEVTAVLLMQPRGFGFVTFRSASSVHEVSKERYHNLLGRWVEVKLAVPASVMRVNPSPEAGAMHDLAWNPSGDAPGGVLTGAAQGDAAALTGSADYRMPLVGATTPPLTGIMPPLYEPYAATGVAAYGVPVYHWYMPAGALMHSNAMVPAAAQPVMLPPPIYPPIMDYASSRVGLAPPSDHGYGTMVPCTAMSPSLLVPYGYTPMV